MQKVLLAASLFALVALPAACGDSSDGGAANTGGHSSGGKGGAGTGGTSSGGTGPGGTGTGGSGTAGASSGGAGTGGTSTGDSGGSISGGAGGSAGTSGGGTGGGSGAGGSSGTSGAAGSGTCGGNGKSYSTNFLGTENPISEGGVWTNGGVVGLDWQNVAKDQGIAYGSGFSAGYNDCIAQLTGFAPNHYAQATVHVVSGYTPPSSHEIELLVRFEITAHAARGYEINNGWNGAYSQIVRWNGPLNDFTYLTPTGPGFGALVDGDVIRAEAIGDTITVYKNGSQVMQARDSTWSDGNPGMAMFIRPGTGALPENYCFKSFCAGDL